MSSSFTVVYGEGAADADIVAAIVRNYPDKTEDTLRSDDPGLFDGVDNGYLLTGHYIAAFEPGEFKKLSTLHVDYRLYTSSETPTDLAEVK